MRLFLLFLILLASPSYCLVIPSDAIWKEKQNLKSIENLLKGSHFVKKAREQLDHYCKPSNDLSFHLTCYGIKNQMFPIPYNEEVLIVRTALDTFFEHEDEVIAYFTKNEKMVLPKKPMNVSIMREFQKKYNI